VTGDIGDEKRSPPRAGSTATEGYDLRSETTEFLTELAKNLSEENETLLALVQRSIEKLREMSGLDKEASRGDGHGVALPGNCQEMATELEDIVEHLRTILTNPSFVPIEEVEVREEEINRLKDGWVKMETRWKEAVHLIDGWRNRMATSGRAVNMEELKMGLRLSPVRVKDVEETSHGPGLRLSSVQEECEEAEMDDLRASPCPAAESLHLIPAPEFELQEESESESSIFQDDIEIEELEADEPNVQILQQSTAFVRDDSPDLPPAPQMRSLKDSSTVGNRGSAGLSKPQRKKPGDFTTIMEENTWDLAADASLPQPAPPRIIRPQKSKQSLTKVSPPAPREPSRPVSVASSELGSSLDSVLLAQPPSKNTSLGMKENQRPPSPAKEERSSQAATAERKPTVQAVDAPSAAPASPPKPSTQPLSRSPVRRVPSRLPLPSNVNPPPLQSPLTMATIAAKLAASEREADAARVRAKLKAARGGKHLSLAPTAPGPVQTAAFSSSIPEDSETPPEKDTVDPVKRDPVVSSSSRQQQQDGEVEGQAEAQVDIQAEQTQPQKRKRDRRASKVASRRRSTLSPWELESLIAGNVPTTPAQQCA
jgi:hypothetical protein